MVKTTLPALLSCLLVAAVALGAAQTVTLKDGRKITGEVTKTDDGYEIKTRFGVVVFGKDQVKSIESAADLAGQYRERAAKARADSVADQFAVAKWAFDAGLLKEARKHLQAAIKLEPKFEKAQLLLAQVQAALAAGPATKPAGGGKKPPVKPGDPDRTKMSKWLLSMEDIYRIRLEELRPAVDKRLIVAFRNNVIERFIERMQKSGDWDAPRMAERFRGLSNVRKVYYILDNIGAGNAAIRDDIQIKSDPRFMVEFRNRIWPLIGQYCASTHCHGQEKAVGGLKLFLLRGERADYTNFAILDLLKVRGGRKLLNRDDVASSLLLQHGLRREQAKYRHPKKLNTPLYSRPLDPRYRRVARWIGTLRADPTHPDYRLTYKAPFGMKLSKRGLPELPTPGPEPKDDKDGKKKDSGKTDLPK